MSIFRTLSNTTHLFSPIVIPIVVLVFVFAGWQLAAAEKMLNEILLPGPSKVLESFVQNFSLLSEQAYYTLSTTLVALALATVIGVALGLLLGVIRRLQRALFPNILFFELIPKIALAPLFVIWLGTGLQFRISFAVFLSFFPVLLATMVGLDAADPLAIRLCQAVCASRLKTFFFVRLPYAIPFIFSGLKVAATMAMIGVVVAEFLTGTAGLGYLIMFAATNLATPLMLASIIFLSFAGMALYWSVEKLERVLAKRYAVLSS